MPTATERKQNVGRWFEIYVDDMDRARKFYEAVLQVKLKKLPTDFEYYTFEGDPNKEGIGGALMKMPGGERPRPGLGTIIYFGSEDCSIEEARIAKAGGKVHKPKFSIGEYGFITLGVDTEGNVFGLHSMR